MIQRDAAAQLRQLASTFKAVAVTGPRQSGKTTMVKMVFPDKPYVNLENPDTRRFAIDDPRGFLDQYADGAILDEIQRTPELFSYLQQILDESKEPGKFILTGSNNFLIQESISQSLAGRVAYLHLLPFTINEMQEESRGSADEMIYRGGYPPIYDQQIDPKLWFPQYIRTYIERDVRQIKNITDLNTFERFLRLCAGRTGQLLNMNALAGETGIDSKTVSSWISVLESSYILFRLFPHHKNFNKRLIKMPKLYFYDTGLAASLLGITSTNDIPLHPLRGALFENLIISEIHKYQQHHLSTQKLSFWRTHKGDEIDLIIEDGQKLIPVEIKSAKTINPEFFKGMEYWQKLSGDKQAYLIYGGDHQEQRSNGIEVVPWREVYRCLGV